MTIEFNCPNCNEIIGFADEHSGKNATCTSCGQRFVIPSKSFEKAEIVKPAEEVLEPVPGFYRAVFIDSWKIFIKPQNVTAIVFVVAAVSFKFFTGHVDYSWSVGGFGFIAPVGLIITLSCWGCLFWFYMEMICSTSIDYDELPEVYMGGLFGFIWNIVKSLFLFSFAFFVVELPCMISFAFFEQDHIIPQILSIAGFSLFPVAILTISVVGDITSIFYPSHILKPVIKAFWPYTIVAGLFILFCQLELINVEYEKLIGRGKFIIGLHLSVNIAIQILAIITMRSIGLFYRHYGCYFKW
jgi:hypothetical protein